MIPDGDVLIHAGDLMYTGYIDEWMPRLEALAALPHKQKIFVAGNHDIHMMLYAGPALPEMRKRGISVLGEPSNNATMKLDNGMTVLGLPYVTNLPRWAFNRTEEQIETILEAAGRADIVVSHSPPEGILDSDGRGSYGIRAYRRYLKRFQPDHWIFGHVHESEGIHIQDGCEFHNVAMCDGNYKMVNKPHIIEL